jgi:hypothetical protein
MNPIPKGLCQCGCGGKTRLAPQRNGRLGWVKGEPIPCLPHHRPLKLPIPKDHGYETPCWIWQQSRNAVGYGIKSSNGRLMGAHRWMWERHHGPIPPELQIDHLCKVTSCVNPEHLRLVSHATNTRHRSGVKMNLASAAAVRADYRAGEGSYRELAAKYGVSRSVIAHIVQGRTWVA